MARGKKHTAEQIVNLLRQVEVGVANGKTLPQACKEVEIVEQTYYRWRKEYGGLKVDQAKRLKELELREAGWSVGKDRVERIWRREGAEGSPETEAARAAVAQRWLVRAAGPGTSESR